MRVHLDGGNDIETGEPMKKSMESLGGIAGVNVSLSESSPSVLKLKLDRVSSISNVEYSQNTLRIWKVYGIGAGKQVNLTKFTNNMLRVRCQSTN